MTRRSEGEIRHFDEEFSHAPSSGSSGSLGRQYTGFGDPGGPEDWADPKTGLYFGLEHSDTPL